MARPTRGTIANYSGNSATPTVSVTCGGTGTRGLRIYVQWRDPGVDDLTSVARDGQTATLVGTKYDGDGWNRAVYDIDDPNANTSDLVVTLSSARDTRIIAFPYSDMDSAGRWGAITSELDLSAAYGSTVTADQELLSVGGVIDFTADAQTFTSDGTGQTELVDALIATQYATAAYQQQTGTVTATYTFSDPANIYESGILLWTANGATALAPTIDTQPTAQTCTINNSSTPTATFTVAATTSGGALTQQWQLEDSVGAGTYTNISNGGIYAGATSASLVITPTTKTGLTGLRVRCNVTDSNGTTTTDAVALTVYTGFQFTGSTTASTNGSGVATVTWTDDRPGSLLGNGGFVKGIATSGAAVSRTSQRPT